MSRQVLVMLLAVVPAFGFFAVGETRCQGTTAQVEAKSRAAREQAGRGRVKLKTAITTPTTGIANKDDGDNPATNPQPEVLKRRAGEQVGNDARGRSQILGMYVQEGDTGRVKVVEVGAATPAFDAGIQRGDELVSFSNFQATNYRKWIDGIGRLATEAKGGDMIAVVVMRNGKELTTEIRAPESRTDAIELPIGLPPQQQPMQTGDQVNVQGTPPGGAGVAIANLGPVADFFGQSASPAAERAVAELFRLLPATGNRPAGVPPAVDALSQGGGEARPAPGTDTLNPGNARIGLAGFRNDPNGMLVMVDVGGLPPGNYTVGIGDASLVNEVSKDRTDEPTNVQRPAGSATESGTALPAEVPSNPTRPAGGGDTLESGQPDSNPVGAPQSGHQRDEELAPRTALAQVVADDVPTTARQALENAPARPADPPTGAASPTSIPATGKVNPSSTLPNGQSAVNKALVDQINRANGATTGGPATITQQVGTLTVDQSGTGRLQQLVEGVQVQHVVGQALVIIAQPGGGETKLPTNLDVTVDGVNEVSAANDNGLKPPAPTSGNLKNAGLPGADAAPVAAGIIRFFSNSSAPGAEPPVSSRPNAVKQPAGAGRAEQSEVVR